MIKIVRSGEPAPLATARAKQCALLVSHQAPARTGPVSASYRRFVSELHSMQHSKCCYCEQVQVPIHNDVEHYRPFSQYWWLAWDWANLLFACRACNQVGGKLDQFPMSPGSIPLAFDEQPPGEEHPELLDPCADDPREHIEFKQDRRGMWSPTGKTWRGTITIHAIGLDRDEFRERYTRHVEKVVMPVVRDIGEGYLLRPRGDFQRFWYRKCDELLDPHREFRALSEDVLRHEFPTFPAPPG